MKVVSQKAHINKDGLLILSIPTQFSDMDVDIVVVINQLKTKKNNYDFSDLAGKLQWKGNALTAQKELRNEWK